jgi:predicted dehydrogenase
MNIAIVGTGYVSDFYLGTLPLHPELVVRGVYDRQPERSAIISRAYGVPVYASLQALLADPQVELVLNLTNPSSHYEVSKAALLAGKHVYSEKPLAMEVAQAKELVALAAERGLRVAGAPCSVLGETAQTLWRTLREQRLGLVRLVYAEMDDGMVHRMQYRKWLSTSGFPWPYKDEFEVGCTLEHAGYYVTWFAAMFGPARRVTTFASTRIPDKLPGETLAVDAPDFTVACIEYHSGVVARLTCGIVAPHDHKLTIVADEGVLCTDEAWDYRSPVYARRWVSVRRKTFLSPLKTRIALPAPPHGKPKTKGSQSMDFARGPAELAAALREGRPSRLSAAFSLHVNEIALAIHHARRDGAVCDLTTTCEPMAPMPWAER